MQLFLELHEANDGSVLYINYANIITIRVVDGKTELKTNGVGSIIRQNTWKDGVEHYPEIYALTYYVRETPEQILELL